jgi:hypothetical protein
MSTSNTPLTDAASKRFDILHCTGSDYDPPTGMYVAKLDMHLLELRLHAAEELLREAAPFVSGFRTATSRAGVASLSDAMQMKDIENRIAAHLANAVDPASATTTKETTK